MSWSIFRENMNQFYQSVGEVDGKIAKKLAVEYDACMKRGGDSLYGISVKEGNVERLEQLFQFAFDIGSRTIGPYDIIGALGRGVTAYWVGATMNIIAKPPRQPIPSIPATGAISNIAVVKNIVLSPGVFPPSTPLPPSPTPQLFLSTFINNATIHLTTLNGLIVTVSTYPPVGAPAPGLLNWSGYRV